MPTTQKSDSSTPVPATVKTTQQQVTDSAAVPPPSAPSAQTSTPAGKLLIAMNEVNIIISLTFVRETVHCIIQMYLGKTCDTFVAQKSGINHCFCSRIFLSVFETSAWLAT